MHPNEIANVNGSIAPIEQTRIAVNDHGFLYGDGVYETVRTYGRRPFCLPAHLDRLERSAEAIRLRLRWDRQRIGQEVDRTLEAAARAGGPVWDGEFAIRIMATRGDGPLGYDPDLCTEPTLAILVTRLRPMTREEREVGIAAIVAPVRRNPIEALDPRIKSLNLLNNILAAHRAKDAGATEAILLNVSGYVAEGTLTNVFFASGGLVMTPSLDCGILSGITREILIDCLRAGRVPWEEGRYTVDQLEGADEVMLTSTTREVIPVARLDGRPVGSGSRGPMTERLQQMFRQRVEEMLRRPVV